jgi:hypothetical protein
MAAAVATSATDNAVMARRIDFGRMPFLPWRRGERSGNTAIRDEGRSERLNAALVNFSEMLDFA